jgi:hypothetical protein
MPFFMGGGMGGMPGMGGMGGMPEPKEVWARNKTSLCLP